MISTGLSAGLWAISESGSSASRTPNLTRMKRTQTVFFTNRRETDGSLCHAMALRVPSNPPIAAHGHDVFVLTIGMDIVRLSGVEAMNMGKTIGWYTGVGKVEIGTKLKLRDGSRIEAAQIVAELYKGGAGALKVAQELLRADDQIQIRVSTTRKSLYAQAAKREGITLSKWALAALDAALDAPKGGK